MDMVDLLEELKGDKGQVEFATSLGITQPTLSRILKGKRQIGTAVLHKLLTQFPEHRQRILDVFLDSGHSDQCN